MTAGPNLIVICCRPWQTANNRAGCIPTPLVFLEYVPFTHLSLIKSIVSSSQRPFCQFFRYNTKVIGSSSKSILWTQIMDSKLCKIDGDQCHPLLISSPHELGIIYLLEELLEIIKQLDYNWHLSLRGKANVSSS